MGLFGLEEIDHVRQANARFASQTEFRRLLEKLPAAAYTCDRDGLITYFNQRAEELWGRAPQLSDPLDRFCGSFKLFSTNGSPIPHSRCWMALALQTGKEYNGEELVIERPDGRRFTTLAHANPFRDASGKLLGAVSVLVDISAHKRAQEALRRTRADRDAQLADLTRLHEMSMRLSTTLELQPILDEILRTASAIEGARAALLSLCDAEHRHVKVAASLGLDAEVVKLLARISPGETCFEQRRRIIVVDVEKDPQFARYREIARLGRFRSIHSTPLITRAGRIIGVLSTHFRRPRRPSEWQIYLLDLCARQAVDFIESARLYGQLNEMHQRKDEFVATLAHELRNPLAPIRNAVNILRTQGQADPAQQWATDVIDRQVKQMTRLVDDLLDLSRITTGKLELRKAHIELKEVLDVAVETSRPLIEARRQELLVNLPSGSIELTADLTRLAQVVANLLSNAAKYTARGGVIQLSAERDRMEAVVTVRDTGIGISADMLPRIFQMFTQADGSPVRSNDGLGIGLTLAKRLTEMHDGTITAKSEGPGKGSEFEVRLPIVAASTGNRSAPSERSSPSVSSLRILVVDDNRDSAESLSMMLRLMGNEVRTGHDGVQALALADELRPDVILLDIGLPGLNGYQVAEAIRQRGWAKSVVLMAITGWGQDSDRRRSSEAGFDHHLVKPVDPAGLTQLLAELGQAKRRVLGSESG